MFAICSDKSLDARVQVRNVGEQWFPARRASAGQVWEAAGEGGCVEGDGEGGHCASDLRAGAQLQTPIDTPVCAGGQAVSKQPFAPPVPQDPNGYTYQPVRCQ